MQMVKTGQTRQNEYAVKPYEPEAHLSRCGRQIGSQWVNLAIISSAIILTNLLLLSYKDRLAQQKMVIILKAALLYAATNLK